MKNRAFLNEKSKKNKDQFEFYQMIPTKLGNKQHLNTV